MTSNKTAQRESTLLSVIAQAHSRGANREKLDRYVKELKFEKSKELVRILISDDRNGSLERWAKSLAKSD